MRQKIFSAFDLTSRSVVEDEVYDGPAIVHVGRQAQHTRVRLTGRLEPIDGQYHWQGTVFADLSGAKQPVTVTVGDHNAEARIVERTPQGGYSVAGVGAPPFTRGDVDVSVPVL